MKRILSIGLLGVLFVACLVLFIATNNQVKKENKAEVCNINSLECKDTKK